MARAVCDDIKAGRLLAELCSGLGFCSASRNPERIMALLPQGIDAVTDAVLLAEGITPEYEKQKRRMVRECVAKHFAIWDASDAA